MKNKIAFVDHNFHKKSRSADFLREIFKSSFTISDYWWSLKFQDKLIKKIEKYDNFFFFQSLLPLNHMLKLKDKNVMWAPMYDNLRLDKDYWNIIKYLNIKVLCFSKKVQEIAKRHKCNHIYLRYYIKPNTSQNKNKKLNIFFWYRGDLVLNDWIKYFNYNQIKQINIFNCPDPGRERTVVNKSIVKKFNIKMINKKFLNKKDYIKFVKYSDVFISPRKQEGIGMSFLEAMSLGKYIVAINDSTMNEYILNRKIGLLISNETSKINSYFIKKNYYYRMNISRKLYLEWLKNKEKIKLFFNEPISRSKFNFFIFIKIKLISVLFYIKKILKKFLL